MPYQFDKAKQALAQVNEHFAYLESNADKIGALDMDHFLGHLRALYQACLEADKQPEPVQLPVLPPPVQQVVEPVPPVAQPKKSALFILNEVEAPVVEPPKEVAPPVQEPPKVEQKDVKRFFVLDSDEKGEPLNPYDQPPVEEEPVVEPPKPPRFASLQTPPPVIEPPKEVEPVQEEEEKKVEEEFSMKYKAKEEEPVQRQPVNENYDFVARHDELFVQKASNEISEKLANGPIVDINAGMGFNARMLYINELFGGNANQFKLAVDELNLLGNFDAARAFLEGHYVDVFHWNTPGKKDRAKEFIKIVRRRYLK